ncbi:hypothetical protein D3C75_1197460 [compost metagenome]
MYNLRSNSPNGMSRVIIKPRLQQQLILVITQLIVTGFQRKNPLWPQPGVHHQPVPKERSLLMVEIINQNQFPLRQNG